MAKRIEVELVGDSSSLERAFGRSTSAGSSWGKKLAGVGKFAALGLVGVGVAAAGVGAKMVSMASDAAEVESKFKTIFGKTVPELTRRINMFADATGNSRFELREQVADMGALLKPLTQTTEQAGNMSLVMTQLATDLGSFNNVPTADALLAIRSGLVGETEPLRRFSILLNAAAVEAEGMRLGLIKQGQELTEQEKVQARYSLILKQSKLAQGDATRTAGSMANQLKALKANVRDAATELGMKLIPFALKVVSAFNEHWPEIQKVATAVFDAIGADVTTVVGFFQRHWPQIQEITRRVADEVRKQFARLVAYWNGTLLPAIRNIIQFARALWKRFGDDIKRNLQTAVTVVRSMLNVIKGIFELVMALIRGDWSAAWKALKDIARNILGGIVAMIKGFVGNVFAAAKAVGGAIKDGIVAGAKALASALGSLLRGAINAVINSIRGFGIPGFKIDPPGPGSFSFPGLHPFASIPNVHTGGDITRSGLAMLQRGERVQSARVANRGRGGLGEVRVVVVGGDAAAISWLQGLDQRARRGSGGRGIL